MFNSLLKSRIGLVCHKHVYLGYTLFLKIFYNCCLFSLKFLKKLKKHTIVISYSCLPAHISSGPNRFGDLVRCIYSNWPVASKLGYRKKRDRDLLLNHPVYDEYSYIPITRPKLCEMPDRAMPIRESMVLDNVNFFEKKKVQREYSNSLDVILDRSGSISRARFMEETKAKLCHSSFEEDTIVFSNGFSLKLSEDLYNEELIKFIIKSASSVFDRNLFFLDFMVVFSLACFFFVSLFFKRYAFQNIVFIYKYCLLCFCHLTVIFLISYFFFFPKFPAFFANTFLFVTYDLVFFKHMLFLLMLFVLLFSFNYGFFYRNLFFLFDFPFMLLFLLFSLFLLLSANDLFFFFLVVELISFSLYILMGLRRTNLFIVESSLKYFIFNALISNIILIAMVALFSSVGSLSFDDVRFLLVSFEDLPIRHNALFFFSLFFIFFAVAFKLGAAPVHVWVADVYEGASLPILSVLILLVKSGYFIFLYQFVSLIYLNWEIAFLFEHLFIIFGLLSLVVGVFGAVYQRKLKRYFAYGSIAHIGFLFLGFGCGLIAWSYVLFYFFIYLILNIALFCFLENYIEVKTGRRFVFLSDFVFLRESFDSSKYAFLILLFSFAGLPPTAGFISKSGIFFSLINSGFYFIFFFSLLFTLISCFYYFRILKVLLYRENKSQILTKMFVSPLKLGFVQFTWSNITLKYFFFFCIYLQVFFFFFFDEIHLFLLQFLLV